MTQDEFNAIDARLSRYLLIGAGDTTDEAVEGNNLAELSRTAIRKLFSALAASQREVERLKQVVQSGPSYWEGYADGANKGCSDAVDIARSASLRSSSWHEKFEEATARAESFEMRLTEANRKVASLESQLAEARATIEEDQAQLRIAWGVVADIGPKLRTANEILIPGWQDTVARVRLWMLGWNIAAAGILADRDTARSQLATSEASAAAMRESLQTLATKELPGRYEEAAQWVRDTALRGVAAEAAKGVLSRLEKAEALAQAVVGLKNQISAMNLIVNPQFNNGEARAAYDTLSLAYAAYAAAKSKDEGTDG